MGPLLKIRTEAGEEEMDLDEFEARVARGEVAPHCPVMFPAITGERWLAAGELEIFKGLYQPRRLYFARAFNLGRFPRVTAILVLLDVAIFAAMSAHGAVGTDTLVAFGAKVAPLIFDLGEFWRLFTANAVHVDMLHIAFNLLVFFNVGGALENAFRTADYLVLVVASALGTTLSSLLFSANAITAGASGIVYGTLGAAVVFGIKYRDILPRRYRRLLGEWAIPPVLAFLYIGWIQKSGVDNFGHLGGLAAGVLTALLLKPRLLAEPHTRLRTTMRMAPLAALALAAVLAGPVARRFLPLTRPFADDDLGLAVEAPSGWHRSADRPGEMALSNGLAGHGRAALAVRARPLAPGVPILKLPESYARSELFSDERAGRLSELVVLPGVPAELGKKSGALLEASYVDDGEATHLRVYFVPRGAVLYEVALAHSADFSGYGAVLERVASSLRFIEPRVVREARAQVLLSPGSPEAASMLGDILSRFGESPGG